MAKLPSVENMGARPIPQSNRGIVSYNPNLITNVTKNLGDQVTKQGEALAESTDKLNLARAKSVLTRASIESQNALDNDPDYGTYKPRYEEAMGTAKAAAMEMVKSPADRELFALDADNAIVEGSYKVKKQADDKHLKVTQISILDSGESNAAAFNAAGSDDERYSLMASQKAQFDAAMTMPGANPLELHKEYKRWQKSTVDNWWGSLSPEDQVKYSSPKFQGDSKAELERVFDHGSKYTKGAISPKYFAYLASKESSGGSSNNSSVPGSTAAGLYGFTEGTSQALGYDHGELKGDIVKSTEAAATYAMQNKNVLEKKLGRPITEAELSLAHMGAGNAIALLKPENQNRPAVEALRGLDNRGKSPEQVVLENGGTLDMTAKQFADIRMGEWNSYKGDEVFAHAFNPADLVSPTIKAKSLQKAQKTIQAKELKGTSQAHVDDIIEHFGDNQQAGYNAAKAIEDPDVRAAVEVSLSGEYTKMKNFDAKAYEDQIGKMTEQVNKGVRVEDLPPEDIASADQKDINALARYQAKQDARSLAPALAIGPVPDNSLIQLDNVNQSLNQAGYRSFNDMAVKDEMFYTNLLTDYTANPHSIAKYSVPQLMANLSPQRLPDVLKYRAEVMKGNLLPAADATARADVVNYAKQDLGLKDAKLAAFTTRFDGMVAYESAAKGKKLSFVEMDKIKDKLAIDLAFGSGDDGRLYEKESLTPNERNTLIVPDEERMKIINDFHDEYGSDQNISDEDISRAYAAKLGF